VFAVDTNILLYGHFDRYPQHGKARAFCERLLSSADDWCIAWQVVYEYVRITTHPSVHLAPLTLGQALADLEPYLSARNGHVLAHTAQHRPVLGAVAAAVPTARGNFIHDLHYAALLREHGVRTLYTADSDFKKFGFLDVIDPTA
jgi:uncharacterized protein